MATQTVTCLHALKLSKKRNKITKEVILSAATGCLITLFPKLTRIKYRSNNVCIIVSVLCVHYF